MSSKTLDKLYSSVVIIIENLSLSNVIVGVEMLYTLNAELTRNSITACHCGLLLAKSSCYNAIVGNNISNNDVGISLYDSSNNNIILLNNIDKNYDTGIKVHSSCYNAIVGNNISNNDVGISLYGSNNNTIFHNNFVNNSGQVGYSYLTNNHWDCGYPSGGNYWSDYNGTDYYGGPYQNETGSDGIGDTPYVIDQNNKDKYPLVRPWIPYAGNVSVEILNAQMDRIGNTTEFTGQMNVTMFSKDISALDVLCRLIITVPYGKKFYSDTCFAAQFIMEQLVRLVFQMSQYPLHLQASMGISSQLSISDLEIFSVKHATY